MMTLQPEGESILKHQSSLSEELATQLIKAFGCRFVDILRAYTFFHVLFLLLVTIEIAAAFFFFNFFWERSLVAFGLSLIFLTGFSYFILRLYYQTRQPEQFRELNSEFLAEAKDIIQYQANDPESHAYMASLLCRLTQSLDRLEYTFYMPPRWFSRLAVPFERVSCWCHGRDLFLMREIILLAVVEEQIKLVKCEATSLEAHTGLANAYILLSQLYLDPRKHEDEEDKRGAPSKSDSEELLLKFRMTAERAIEEFKILCYYAPNDPWIHEQLAYSYCDLGMPLEAIKEYEAIIHLSPNDVDTLYKLGILYFQLGQNALGLQVYEKLKSSHYKKAEMLIAYYSTV